MGVLEHKPLKGIEKAAALHQQGRLEEAAAAYRRLASASPQAWQPSYLLGLLELQRGKLDAACLQLVLATERGADHADAWFHLGECRFGLEQFTEAADAYRRALVRAPKHAMSAFNLGRSLQQVGDMSAAAQAYRNALTLQPVFPEALNNLAITLRTLGDMSAAAAALRQAIEMHPDFMPAYMNLAHLLDEDAADSKAAIAVLRGALEQLHDFVPAQFQIARLLAKTKAYALAGIAYRRVVELEPAHADAWCNLGALYFEGNLIAHAEDALQRAVTLDPQLAQAWGNLGSVLRHKELFDQAQAAFSTAVQLRPDIAQFYLGLGLVYSDRGDLDNAREWLQRALDLQSGVSEMHAALANVLQKLGDTDAAGQAYTRALELQDHPGLRIKRAMMLSPVMQSLDALRRERACFEAQLSALIVDPVIASQEDLLKYPDTAFYLAYHGRNDRLLLEKLAKVFRLACPQVAYVADSIWRERVPGPIRIGFVSRFFHSHVVSRFFGPLIDHLAQQSNFQVYLIPVGERRDSEIERLAAVCQGCERLSTLSLSKARTAIAQLELDILVYPEIGMDPFTYLLAHSHLARVQCVLQGHSITTGLSSIDYYISSDWVEPPDAKAHYTERLVRLDALPICLQPPVLDVAPVSRHALGLPEQGTFYLCPMKLQKIHPDMDQAIAAILRNDSTGHVAFVRDDAHPSWHRAIAERIALAAPECIDRLHFVPWAQTTPAFLGLIAAADVMLDSFYHGGATTSHLCLSSGAPMVAWDAGSARSGYILAYYRLLGLDECIARTQEEYAQIAVRLGRDRVWREQIRTHILTNRERLYDNQRTFDAYARFFRQVLEPVRPPPAPGDPYRMLEGLRSFCSRTHAPIAWIEPSCLAIVPGPAVFEQPHRERARQIRLPDGYLAELPDVEVIGGQSFVLADDVVLCDLVEGPSAACAQLETDVLIHHVGSHVLINSSPRAEEVIERGVLLAGRASENYYHWLLEFLPRLALLEDSGKYEDWPLLIDAGLHPNLKEALARVCGADRTLVELKRGVRYGVKRLAAPSPLAWMPVDLKPGSVLQPGDVVFSKRAVQFLRERLGAQALKVAPKQTRRLFLARPDAPYRRLINEAEIQAVFVRHGFEIVRPERMSVQEQIETFASAEVIAGATGAGFTNIVFAPPETTILVLYYPQTALFYFHQSGGYAKAAHGVSNGRGHCRQQHAGLSVRLSHGPRAGGTCTK